MKAYPGPGAFDVWFYLRNYDLCVAVPAKCGGSSFYRYAVGVPDAVPDDDVRSFAVRAARVERSGPFTPVEVRRYFATGRKLLAVRDPVDRFRSLWRDKCRRTLETKDDRTFMRGWSPTTLLEHVRGFPFGNPHWVPQYLYRVPRVELVPYDELPRLLGYGDRPPVRATTRTHVEVDERRVRALYAQDVALWRETQRTWDRDAALRRGAER